MTRTITRRLFIRSVIASVASIGVGGCAPWKGMTTPPATNQNSEPLLATLPEQTDIKDQELAPIVELLRKEFDYLRLDAAGLVAFAQDFRSKAGKKVLDQQHSDIGQFTYILSTQYLMSSDFFWNGADESRIVKYVSYYDVYNGCTSPFARFD